MTLTSLFHHLPNAAPRRLGDAGPSKRGQDGSIMIAKHSDHDLFAFISNSAGKGMSETAGFPSSILKKFTIVWNFPRL